VRNDRRCARPRYRPVRPRHSRRVRWPGLPASVRRAVTHVVVGVGDRVACLRCSDPRRCDVVLGARGAPLIRRLWRAFHVDKLTTARDAPVRGERAQALACGALLTVVNGVPWNDFNEFEGAGEGRAVLRQSGASTATRIGAAPLKCCWVPRAATRTRRPCSTFACSCASSIAINSVKHSTAARSCRRRRAPAAAVARRVPRGGPGSCGSRQPGRGQTGYPGDRGNPRRGRPRRDCRQCRRAASP
jgi:hypothetical protein